MNEVAVFRMLAAEESARLAKQRSQPAAVTTSKGCTWEITDTTAKDLSTGLVWNLRDEEGIYTFNEAIEKFGHSIPTKEEFELAKEHGCDEVLKLRSKYYWTFSVYKVGHAWVYWGGSPPPFNSSRTDLPKLVRCVGR